MRDCFDAGGRLQHFVNAGDDLLPRSNPSLKELPTSKNKFYCNFFEAAYATATNAVHRHRKEEDKLRAEDELKRSKIEAMNAVHRRRKEEDKLRSEDELNRTKIEAKIEAMKRLEINGLLQRGGTRCGCERCRGKDKFEAGDKASDTDKLFDKLLQDTQKYRAQDKVNRMKFEATYTKASDADKFEADDKEKFEADDAGEKNVKDTFEAGEKDKLEAGDAGEKNVKDKLEADDKEKFEAGDKASDADKLLDQSAAGDYSDYGKNLWDLTGSQADEPLPMFDFYGRYLPGCEPKQPPPPARHRRHRRVIGNALLPPAVVAKTTGIFVRLTQGEITMRSVKEALDIGSDE